MSYHGTIPIVKKFLLELPRPVSVLEVGVDRGVTFLSIVTFLARAKEKFTALGIDIKVQEQVSIMLQNLDRSPQQMAFLLERNSLEALPDLVSKGMKFDVVFLDGDHNYHTVSKELELIGSLLTNEGIIVIDDYEGRWSERDLWYAERPGYEDVTIASSKVDTEKHGVKPAVDEWLAKHPEWKKGAPVGGEPVILTRHA